MKLKFLFNILSIASLGTIIPVTAHQEVNIENEDKKQNIDIMLEEIAEIIKPGRNLDFTEEAHKLYKKYGNNPRFQDIIDIFINIRDNCARKMPIRKVLYSFSCTYLKRNLYLLERLEREESCNAREKHNELYAIDLYTYYSGSAEFLNMRLLFEEIAKIQDTEKQKISHGKKQHIDAMLDEILKNFTKAIFGGLDEVSKHLYSKYRTDKNFIELIEVFRCIKAYDQQEITLTKIYTFDGALKDIKQYLNEGTNHRLIAAGLIRYRKVESFIVMRNLFEKIAKIQENEQNLYKKAMENFRMLNRYNGLGIGRHK